VVVVYGNRVLLVAEDMAHMGGAAVVAAVLVK
jgi:hypothetical protein